MRGLAVLDVCCGTGDLALAFARAGARVVGVDFTPEMLARALGKRGGGAQALFATGDALALPVASASADVAAVAFGLRNLADARAGLCRDGPRRAAGGPGAGARVQPAAPGPPRRVSTAPTPRACCPGSAAWSRATARPTATCRAPWRPGPRRKSSRRTLRRDRPRGLRLAPPHDGRGLPALGPGRAPRPMSPARPAGDAERALARAIRPRC